VISSHATGGKEIYINRAKEMKKKKQSKVPKGMCLFGVVPFFFLISLPVFFCVCKTWRNIRIP
jgi:hypothetical protein